MAKYEELKKGGKLDNYVRRKNKKLAAKDRKRMKNSWCLIFAALLISWEDARMLVVTMANMAWKESIFKQDFH